MQHLGKCEQGSEFFKLLTNNSFDIIMLLSEDGSILYENDAIKNILGYDSGKHSGKNAFDFIHPEDKPVAISKFNQLIKEPDFELTAEFRCKSGSGNWVWLEAKGRNLYSNDIINGILINLRIITENKDAYLKIRQLYNRLESAFLSGVIAWWEMELPSGKIWFHMNKTKMLGRNPNDFTHYKHFMDIVHPDDYEVTMQAVRDHISGKKETYECAYRIKHSDGYYMWFHDVGQITQRMGENLVMTGIVTDLSDFKNVEQALQESEERYRLLNATKDKFFSIISHDLRGQVGTIISFSELALKVSRTKDYDKIIQYCKIINDSAKRNFDLLNNLLDWSRVQTGRIEFKPEKLDLNDLVNGLINFMTANAYRKNIQFSVDIPKDLEIFADKNMIDTVLRNLLSNAIKYTHQKGWVKLSALKQNGETIIQVQDNGVAIDKEGIDKLFKIEHSYSTPGTNKEKGTGLGLILCKEFIEKHGGEIWAESEVNKGTTFNFTLKT